MAFRLFGRFRKPQIRIPDQVIEGFYQQVWERKTLPGPGVQNYAFETLALNPFSPIGPSVTTRNPIMPLQPPQPYIPGKAVALVGIPTVAGQLVGQPLFDPNNGYSAALPVGNLPFSNRNAQL